MKINVQLLAKNDVLFYFESAISKKQCYKFYIKLCYFEVVSVFYMFEV